MAKSLGIQVGYEEGCAQENNDTSGFAAAESLAKSSDVVIAMLGLRNCQGGQGEGGPNCESEGHDRDELGLPGMQLELLKLLAATGTPVVLVVTNGGPLSLPWASTNIPAIMYSWYGGLAAGEALADVLFNVNGASPSGRLPFTVLQSVDDLPNETSMALTAPPYGRTYRYLTGKQPQFAFGFGLSYTNFLYSNLKVSATSVPVSTATIDICFTLKNVGSKSSDEVVELYAARSAADNNGLSSVPKVQLVAFNRTAVLQPEGEISMCLQPELSRLALFKGGKMEVQPGHYTIYVGGSAPGSLGVNVQRTAVNEPLEAEIQLV